MERLSDNREGIASASSPDVRSGYTIGLASLSYLEWRALLSHPRGQQSWLPPAIMRAGAWKSFDVVARYLELAVHNVWV